MNKEELFAKIDKEPDLDVGYYKGYIYKIRRNEEMLNYCGYIFIPHDHPSFALIENDYQVDDILDMHGGCTYFDYEYGYIIVGFDCAHVYDIVPFDYALGHIVDGTYKDYDYVLDQIKHIINQLVKITPKKLQKEYENRVEVEYAKMYLLF